MGTGGTSLQLTPIKILKSKTIKDLNKSYNDPYQNRTGVAAVRGRSLNRLTNGPPDAPSGTRTQDPLIKSQLLYRLS